MAWITLTIERGAARHFQTAHIVSYGADGGTGTGTQVQTINGAPWVVHETPEQVLRRVRDAERWEYERLLDARHA